MSNLYAPLFHVPADAPPGPVIYDYDRHQEHNNHLRGRVKVKVDVNAALNLADTHALKTAVMKQVAVHKEITLSQLQILFGWAFRKSQVQGHR